MFRSYCDGAISSLGSSLVQRFPVGAASLGISSRRARRSEAGPGSGRAPGQVTEYAYSSAKDQRLLTAQRAGAGPTGEAWVSVYVAVGTFNMHAETNNHPLALVDVVQAAAMETKMVTIDASAMAKDIAATGHVALYGILFDTEKTDIKPESSATIAEVAKYLKANPSVKLYVVGHTDNVGGHTTTWIFQHVGRPRSCAS